MGKIKRQTKILEIISKESICTQEQLLERLNSYGFDVTQATVSRDIRELKLIKVVTPDGEYAYGISNVHEKQNISFRFHAIFKESVSKIDFAKNLIVIKCYTGMANAACAAIDTMELSGVVGTIAGDDTILIVAKDDEYAADLVEELYKLLGK